MAKKAVSALLALLIVLACPGGSAWLAFAAQPKVDYSYDTKTEKMRARSADAAAEDPLSALKRRLSDPALRRKVSSEQIHNAEDFVRRYEGYLNAQNASPEALETLRKVIRNLDDNSKEASLSLDSLFELSDYARSRDALGTFTVERERDEEGQTLEVRSHALGKVLFTQRNDKLGINFQRKVIRRPGGHGAKGELDAVILDVDKGAAQDSKIAYNRRLVMLFRSVKKYYYDQPYLKRRIKEFKDGKIDDPSFDLKVAEKELNDKQAKFGNEAGIVLKYLEWLDKLGPEGLEQLAQADAEALFAMAEKLEEVQRIALRFYNDSQLLDMQKAALQQITFYFSQVTNTSPKKKKETSKASKGDAKELAKLQKVLGEYEKGSLESYAPLMEHFGITKLSAEDRKFVKPELLALASEAFSAVAYAGAAHQRSMKKGLSSEEVDAAIEESQQWLRVAQVHLQSFDLQTLTIQVERLKLGQLRDRVGLDRDDAAMKAQADKLIKASQGQYLPRLAAEARQTQKMLLKQAVASFHLTYLNAANASLYADTLKERVRAMAAKAAQMRALYLALEFDKVKNSAKYEGRFSAEGKLEGLMYQKFLSNLSGRVERNARDLETLSNDLNGLARLQVVEEIRAGLKPAEEEFERLAAELGFDEIPDLADVQKEASNLSIKQGKIFSAISDFSNRMRFFDNFNELDIYLRKYASSERAASETDSRASYFFSFKWLEQGFGKVPGRNRAIEAGMSHLPWFKEAAAKLGGERNRKLRGEVLDFLRQGRYEDAYRKIAELDPDLAKKASRDYEREKSEDDPYEALDFESYMSRGPEDKGLARALEVVTGHFGLFSKYMIGYNVVSAATDAVITTFATAGVGQVAGWAAQWSRGITAAEKAGQLAKSGAAGARLSRGLQIWDGMRQYRIVRAVQSVGEAWGHNFIKVVDAADMPAKLNRAQKLRHAARMYFTEHLVHSAKATAQSVGIMGLASGGTQAVHHWAAPETSQYKDKADAFKQGLAFGTSFGAKGSIVMLMSPVPSTAFGAGRIGNTVRALANTPGPVSGAVHLGAKVFKPSSLVAELGPLEAMQLAMGKSATAEWLGGAALWGIGMVDGAAKYWLAAELPNWAAQYGHFAYTGAKEKLTGNQTEAQAGATPYVTRLAQAQDFGVLVSQASWLFVPVNPMYSPREVKTQTREHKIFNHLYRTGHGLEMERAIEGQKVVENAPWHLRSWRNLLRGEKVELAMHEHWSRMARERRLRAEGRAGSRAETVALALETSKSHGKVVALESWVRDLGTVETAKESRFGKPSQGGAVDARDAGVVNLATGRTFGEEAKGAAAPRLVDAQGREMAPKPASEALERRVTNEGIATAKDMLMRELRGNSEMRRAILEARELYTLKDQAFGEVAIRGKKLAELKNMASMASLERFGGPGTGLIGSARAAAGRFFDLLAGRRLETQYDRLVGEVQDGIKGGTAEAIIKSAQSRMDRIIKDSAGLDRLALEHSRRTIESNAFTRYANERLAREMDKGIISKEFLRSADLFIDVWEKGVFGRLFGGLKERKVERVVGGKTQSEIERYYSKPEFEFRDAHGRLITDFQPLQRQAILETLTLMAQGKKMVFNLLSTGGGKTLLGFVMLDFMEAFARQRGRQGTFFVTTNGELVAQAKEAYAAFFKGRKPPFEIITYSDLMAQLAQSDATGSLSPFATHDFVWDEADEPGVKTALSLGQYQGELGLSKLDPALAALRGEAVRPIETVGRGPGWGISEILRENSAVFDAKDAKANMHEGTFVERLSSDKVLRQSFSDLVDRTTVKLQEAIAYGKTEEFINGIDISLYPGMTREQVAVELRRQHHNAFGAWNHVGVIERQHGTLRNWVEKILEGAYITRSQRDLSKVYKHDAERNKVYPMHNDTVYESLDTIMRSTLELKHGTPLTLDFETLVITDFRRLNEAARESGALVVGLSGTLPDEMVKFMAKDIGWEIRGKGTVLPRVKSLILEGKTALDGVAEAALKAKTDNAKGRPHVAIFYADSVGEAKAMEARLDSIGVPEARRSLQVYPGSNFDAQNLFKGADVARLKNNEALAKGEVDVMILVGQDGLRGLDPIFDAYAGGEVSFYVTSPELLAHVSQKQLFGRTYGKRVPEADSAGRRTTKSYYLITEAASLRGNKDYKDIVKSKLEQASRDEDLARWNGLKVLLKGKVPAGKTLEESIETILEDPKLYEERLAYSEYQAISALKKHLGQARIREALKDEALLRRVSLEPEVFETLVWPLQKKAERQALSGSGVHRN